MWFQAWFDAIRNPSPFRRKGTAARRGADRRRLFLEGLEDRRVLALAAPVNYDAGASPQAIVSVDFNNDDVPDLAVANYSSSNVSVLLGNADGTFQPALTSATGANPISIAVGDFDEDGILDLATVNGDGFAGEVSVLLGNGDNDGNGTGTFAAPASVWSGSSPTSVAVGDFDGDGKLDLGVTSVYYYGWWYGYYSYADVLLGTGTGNFSGPNSTWLDWGYYTASTAANLDGDVSLTGHPIDDFVAVNPDYGTISVLLGDSSGYLQSASYLSAGSYPGSVAAGDVNGDFVMDLVATDRVGNDVSVLLGTGSGAFAQAQSYPVGSNPTAVVIGDFNHDMRTDIATANYGSGDLSVLYNRDNDTFSPAVNSASPGAYALVAGDFDGDGWLDAATANPNANNISVLANDQSWPPAPSSLAIDDVTVTEGNAGTLTANFTVTRSSEDLTGTVTVNYSTANGGALAGSDYVAASGMLTFEPGETTKTIAILVIGDLTDEYDQGFYVNLSGASNAVITDGQGFGNILDNDDAPTISITPIMSAKEGPNNKTTWFDFLVTLSAPSEKEVLVNFTTVNDTATTANNDYVAKSGTLIFAPGVTSQTISVQVKGDKNKESNERFFVDLSGASNATIALTRGIGEILDDDSPGGKRNR